MVKNIFLAIALLTMIPFFAGCEVFQEAWEEAMTGNKAKEDEQPKYSLAFYGVVPYPRGSDREMEIVTFDGIKIWINRLPMMTSGSIKEVKLVPVTGRPDYYDLMLYLDHRGVTSWNIMAGRYYDEPVAVMLDNVYLCTINPRPVQDDGKSAVLVTGPFNSVISRGIAENAKRNKDLINPSPTRPLW